MHYTQEALGHTCLLLEPALTLFPLWSPGLVKIRTLGLLSFNQMLFEFFKATFYLNICLLPKKTFNIKQYIFISHSISALPYTQRPLILLFLNLDFFLLAYKSLCYHKIPGLIGKNILLNFWIYTIWELEEGHLDDG